MTIEALEEYIAAIHAAPQQLVIEFAGAGAQALTWLHGVGGSSRTILEATDRYAAASLIGSIGFRPKQFASPQVARAMATQAYIRACQLAKPGLPVAGLGCTAAIATDRPKRGEHRCCLAVYEERGVTAYTLTLQKGLRSRREEEMVISLLILKAVGRISGLEDLSLPDLADSEVLTERFEPIDLPTRLLAEEFGWLLVMPAGPMIPGNTLSHIALLSGAFNPLHQGHRYLARAAANWLGQEIYFELPLMNAEKAPIDVPEARRRLAQFANLAPVMLTRAPLFSQKAALFPHSVFIIGADTVKRLIEPRFYHNDPAEMRASFEAVRAAGCRFLVAGRLQGELFLTLDDIKLPAGYRELFEPIPEHRFRMDISSTAIREGSASVLVRDQVHAEEE